MNRYDDRYPRSQRPRDDQDEWRHRSYGFEEGEYTGRTAGDDDQQPFSRNPYGYHPGQSRDQRFFDRGSERSGERYGQREPYNTGRYDQDRGERDRGNWQTENSRYSESQFGQRRRPVYGRDVDARYGEGRGFGEGPFADRTEAPHYFGTGNYAEGGARATGGFDQRTRPRNYGSLGEDTFTSDRDRGWGWEGRESQERRQRKGPKGYTRSDERLREDISERLMMADSIDSSEVSISVKDGKVTIEGTVPNRRMKHAIEDLVDAAPGVQDIDNRVRVQREDLSSSGLSTPTPAKPRS